MEQRMPEEYETMTFGRYLQAKRQESGLDLEEISRETKVGKEMLKAIENEDHPRFPEEVYVKGFLRSYARLVGADEDAVVRSYSESRRDFLDIRQSEEDFVREQQNFWPRIILAMGVFIGVIVISVLAFSLFQGWFGFPEEKATKPAVDSETTVEEKSKQPDKEFQTGNPENKMAVREDTSPRPAVIPENTEKGVPSQKEKPLEETQILENAPPAEASEKKPAPLELALTATEVTWLKVIIDGKTVREFSLKPGEQVSLEAYEQYNLLIGNAGGLKLKLNEKNLPVPGKSGQVVNLMIP